MQGKALSELRYVEETLAEAVTPLKDADESGDRDTYPDTELLTDEHRVKEGEGELDGEKRSGVTLAKKLLEMLRDPEMDSAGAEEEDTKPVAEGDMVARGDSVVLTDVVWPKLTELEREERGELLPETRSGVDDDPVQGVDDAETEAQAEKMAVPKDNIELVPLIDTPKEGVRVRNGEKLWEELSEMLTVSDEEAGELGDAE